MSAINIYQSDVERAVVDQLLNIAYEVNRAIYISSPEIGQLIIRIERRSSFDQTLFSWEFLPASEEYYPAEGMGRPSYVKESIRPYSMLVMVGRRVTLTTYIPRPSSRPQTRSTNHIGNEDELLDPLATDRKSVV